MTTFTINRLAERSGFSASTLRYYEQVGLLAEPPRTSAGYRLYDEEALQRLRFVSRAKALGLSLREIRDLVSAWDSEPCGGVRDRLHALVTAKQAAIGRQIGELAAISGQLSQAQVELTGRAPAGRCGAGCGCASASVRTPVALECTLDSAGQQTRQSEWAKVVAHATARQPVADGVALRFPADAGLAGRLAELALAEQACCAFLAFTMSIAGDGLRLIVTAPEAGAEVVHTLVDATAGAMPMPYVLPYRGAQDQCVPR